MPDTRTTTDGHTYTDAALACLIGDSLDTPARCAEAVALLAAALGAGVARERLWRIAAAAVWDGLDYARTMSVQPAEKE